jgi:hypothetical protein
MGLSWWRNELHDLEAQGAPHDRLARRVHMRLRLGPFERGRVGVDRRLDVRRRE